MPCSQALCKITQLMHDNSKLTLDSIHRRNSGYVYRSVRMLHAAIHLGTGLLKSNLNAQSIVHAAKNHVCYHSTQRTCSNAYIQSAQVVAHITNSQATLLAQKNDRLIMDWK
jgi:hypothetical protein